MDVPFHSSGALSRAHYAIVRKVESSPSIQNADQHLALEVKSIQAQLYHPKLSIDKCKECLVILLYCASAVSHGFLPGDAFDFAFPHAINLAEAARKIEDKRLGYLFCSGIMPKDHELRLMLVNTLRKDLESDDVARICLALDNLVTSPNEDVIPAVQSRLHDLLSHDHAHVRRRALFAFRSLSVHDRALLDRIHGSILTRLKDSDHSVLQAALAVACGFPGDMAISTRVNKILKNEASLLNGSRGIISSAMKFLRTLELSETNAVDLFDIFSEVCLPRKPDFRTNYLILDLFRLLSQLPPSVLLNVEKSKNLSVVQSIRHLLVSHNQNDVYFFMRCLETVDASVWAGTTPDHPAVLDGLEFERILQLLDSQDRDICQMTLRVINKVDPGILDTRIGVLMQTTPSVQQRKEFICRVLEVAVIQYAQDGEGYARQVLDVIQHLDKAATSVQVIKDVIEVTLTDIRGSLNSNFIESSTNKFMAEVVDQSVAVGPTALIIATALATEFSASLAVPPLQVLSALATRLKTCPSVAQEPCLITMMRIRANCDDVPSEISENVNQVSQSGRQIVRLRCKQFLEFVSNKQLLVKIVEGARSSSLPDFLASVHNHTNQTPAIASLSTSPPNSRSSSRASGPSASLKYAAYDAPEVTSSLRTRRLSASQFSASSPHSDSVPDGGRHRVQPRTLSPISAGHLALAHSLNSVQVSQEVERTPSSDSKGTWHSGSEATRADLINLESPFQGDDASSGLESSSASDRQEDFESVWNSYNEACDLRGWCKTSIDSLIRRLQRVEGHHLRVISADLAPFIGELKIVMIANKSSERPAPTATVALRLRESEEDSCLWRLRCAEVAAGERMQGMFE